jgi:hypothetical protein
MKSKSNKTLYEASIKKAKPFPFIHIYKCLIESRRGQCWVKYPMHCDYPEPRCRQNLMELRNRFRLAYGQFRLVKIKVLKSKVNNG